MFIFIKHINIFKFISIKNVYFQIFNIHINVLVAEQTWSRRNRRTNKWS